MRLFSYVTLMVYFLHAQGADKYTDENRPYEFGFNIEGEQHRHEKKDENGLIMGEFGFITADGVYHVTVYATDENGNFKILSMKNIRVKPYPTGPEGKSPKALPFPPSSPSGSKPPPPPQTAVAQPNPAAPTRTCSSCKIPTTPKPQLPPADQQGPNYNTPSQNYPQEPSREIQQPNSNYPQGNDPQYQQPNPNYPSGKDPQYHQSNPNYLSGNEPQYQQPNSNYPKGNNPQYQPSPNYPQGNGPYYEQPNPNFSQGNAPQTPSRNFIQDDANNFKQPGSGGPGERNPKQYDFDNNGQSAALPGQPPRKPQLISAQMQIVDKNTDIYSRKPGEREGLPQGLNKNDMTQLLYTFNYTVGFHGHHEEGYTNGAKKGYYFVTGRDGRRTRVDYEADENGFRPKITQEVLDILSEEVPKEETEKDEKYGLKGYEFKWLYYPSENRRR